MVVFVKGTAAPVAAAAAAAASSCSRPEPVLWRQPEDAALPPLSSSAVGKQPGLNPPIVRNKQVLSPAQPVNSSPQRTSLI